MANVSALVGRSATLCLVMLWLPPAAAGAIPAITCHCFTDRSYDPARPAAADPYVLATTHNTFFALVFNTDKRAVVMQKQQGESSDDLWIAYWVASRSGRSPSGLLQAKKSHDAWQDVIAPLRLSPEALGAAFSGALQARSPTAGLANAVVDEVFRTYRLLSDEELGALRQAGATNQELIISTVISAKTRQPAGHVHQDVRGGSRTWGALLQSANIDPVGLPREIAAILKLQAR